MYHFFVTSEQIQGGYVRISGADVNHIRNVLRMKAGEKIGVRDGVSRNYVCELEELETDQIMAKILSEDDGDTELPAEIWLFQGLPKGDKMELVVQKAVELGVHRIVPVATKRSVVKLDAKKEENKIRRWNLIAESAAKQSGRMMIPEVSKVMTLEEAFTYSEHFDLNLIPYELAEGMQKTRAVYSQVRPEMQIGIFIGPEGGFDAEEISSAIRHRIQPVTLGRRILRTETAGLAALSILMYHLER